MKIAVISLLSALLLITGSRALQDTKQPSDQVKIAKRDAKYSERTAKPGMPATDRKISEQPAGGKIQVILEHAFVRDGKTPEMKIAEAANERAKLTCSASVIARGQITDSKGFVTADDSSIYTVYKFRVDEVLRGSVQTGQTLEITGEGGIVFLAKDKPIQYRHPFVPYLYRQEYILFLEFDSETGDYRLIDGKGVYSVTYRNGISAVSRSDLRRADKAAAAKRFKVPYSLSQLTAEIQATKCGK